MLLELLLILLKTSVPQKFMKPESTKLRFCLLFIIPQVFLSSLNRLIFFLHCQLQDALIFDQCQISIIVAIGKIVPIQKGFVEIFFCFFEIFQLEIEHHEFRVKSGEEYCYEESGL